MSRLTAALLLLPTLAAAQAVAPRPVDAVRTGAFQDPRDLAVGSDGRVLVTDTGNGRVQVFARGGQYLTQLTARDVAPAGFAPLGITVDAADRVYITDSDNNRLEVFTTTLA